MPAAARASLTRPGVSPPSPSEMCTARAVGAVVVARRHRQADRARQAHARGARRQAHEGRRRRGVPVERPGALGHEERRGGRWVAAKAEQVLEAQALAFVGGQQLGRRQAGDLVAQRPQRVQAHGLVAGRVREHVGVVAVGGAQVVVERVEEQRGGEAPRRDGAPGMTRGGHVVEQQGAQRPVEQVEGLEGGQVGRREGGVAPTHLRAVHPDRPPRPERPSHHKSPFERRRPCGLACLPSLSCGVRHAAVGISVPGPRGRRRPRLFGPAPPPVVSPAARAASRARRPARRRRSRNAVRQSARAACAPAPRRRRCAARRRP